VTTRDAATILLTIESVAESLGDAGLDPRLSQVQIFTATCDELDDLHASFGTPRGVAIAHHNHAPTTHATTGVRSFRTTVSGVAVVVISLERDTRDRSEERGRRCAACGVAP